jgi:16S rRNA (cytosine967-C5)-methyltransferase
MKAEGGKVGRTVSPARRAAFDILRRVEEEGAYAAPLLASSETEMRADDRGLCYELVLGILRWQSWLDALIEHYSGRSPSSLDAPVRHSLRLGLYQLRFLSRIPASASVNESVNLAYVSRVRSAAPFINAVLRRAVREPQYDPAAGIDDSTERLAIETSHPVWLLERWIKTFGRAEAEELASANNAAPPVAFRVLPRAGEPSNILKQLQDGGGEIFPSQIVPGAWRIQGAAPLVQQLAHDQKIYVQDEASQLVAYVVGAASGERILDVCAAPGSKTTHVAALSPDAALIVAGDIHEHRARSLERTISRQQIKRVAVILHDAEADLPYASASFDRVLVDAPCSGTGTLRRNPEIRWRISATDILDLSGRQRRILASAAQMVRNGGRLVYSNCSVEIEENEDVVANFLNENRDFKPTPLHVPLTAQLELPNGAVTARTWPHRGGADGFFIASFERNC